MALVDGGDLRVGVTREKGEQLTGDLTLGHLPGAGPVGPDAGEEGELSIVAEREPHGFGLAIGTAGVLREGREWD